MALKAKNYREEIYRLRAHPSSAMPEDFVDDRDSFLRVYASLIPFLAGEYFLERAFDLPVSGLIFPIGFLLFWAFYYTYYRPDLLEDQLSVPAEFHPGAILNLLFGVAIWFIKVSVVGVFELFINYFGLKPKPKPVAQRRPVVVPPPRPSTQMPPRMPPKVEMPREVLEALATLGLPPQTNWDTIHHRYRELAKKFHPDLNREITNVGSRFMAVDAAYKKLNAYRPRYFR